MNTKLINAVKRQLGEKDNPALFSDIAEHGADAGFTGFMYHTETEAFYSKNRYLIIKQAKEDQESIGDSSLIHFISAFPCLRRFLWQGQNNLEERIAKTLFTADIDAEVASALACHALEAVSQYITADEKERWESAY